MRPHPLLLGATLLGCGVPSLHELESDTWVTTESTTGQWPAESEETSTSSSTGMELANRCGDGIVAGTEQCDPGPEGADESCDDRCFIPGNVMWSLSTDAAVHDLDVSDERLVVCSDGVLLFSLEEAEPTELPLDPRPACARVALAPDGGFATIAWLDEPLDSELTDYAPAGHATWSTLSLDFRPQAHSHPDLAWRGENIVVVGTAGDGVLPRAAEYGPFGEVVWVFGDDASTAAEFGALALPASGEIVIAGNLNGGDVAATLALDNGALRYQGVADLTYGHETVRDIVVVDDVILAVIDAGGMAVLASFRPPDLAPHWTRVLSADHGGAVALAPHAAGAVLSYVDGGFTSLELVGADGAPTWSTSWSAAVDASDATVVANARGDIFVASSGAAGEVRAFAAPR